MQKNTSVTIGAHFEQFIGDQVASGHYESVSEIIREGLRLLEEKEAKLTLLRKALEDGENSGTAKYSLQGLIQELDADELK